MRTIWLMTVFALFGVMALVAAQTQPAQPANYFERNGIAVKFPEDFKSTDSAPQKTVTAESPDGAVKFHLFATELDNFDNVDEQILQKFFSDSYTALKKTGENHHERGGLALRTEAYSAKAKVGGAAVTLYVQFAIMIPTDGARTVLLVSVSRADSGDKYIAAITDVFMTESKAGEMNKTVAGGRSFTSELAALRLEDAGILADDLRSAFKKADETLIDETQENWSSPLLPMREIEADHAIVVSAQPDACTDACANKQKSCANSCENKHTRCIVQCGGPLGSDKCVQQCNDDRRACSLQCTAEAKICEVRCKTGQ